MRWEHVSAITTIFVIVSFLLIALPNKQSRPSIVPGADKTDFVQYFINDDMIY